MTILDTIIASKRKEVSERKKLVSISDLENAAFFQRPVISLKESILDPGKTGIIAEFKRRSPSRGMINRHSPVDKVTMAYTAAGASALSILTDEEFFGGSTADLLQARVNNIPILRKDFIIDEYQVFEARSMGADVILLIASCLTKNEVRNLGAIAKSMSLEILLELHDDNELDHINEYTEIVGINNRNLKTFEVDMEKSIRMADRIGNAKVRVAESGISRAEDIITFRNHGFEGFLVGERFMKEEDPGEAFNTFVTSLKSLV